jgi:hypothetical protein
MLLGVHKCTRGRNAGVVKLVDAPDSKSGSERSVGSSPTTRTICSQVFQPLLEPRFSCKSLDDVAFEQRSFRCCSMLALTYA